MENVCKCGSPCGEASKDCCGTVIILDYEAFCPPHLCELHAKLKELRERQSELNDWKKRLTAKRI